MDLRPKQPWFGPKQLTGWGWTLITWQGWLTTLVFVVAFVAELAVTRASMRGIIAAVATIVVYGVIVMLTGTAPGGPTTRS